MSATTEPGGTAMAREIAEQPDSLARTLEVLLPRREEVRRVASGRRHVLFVARGSADDAGVYGRYLVEAHTGLGAGLAAPSLATHYAVQRDLSDTVAVCLSQSGETGSSSRRRTGQPHAVRRPSRSPTCRIRRSNSGPTSRS